MADLLYVEDNIEDIDIFDRALQKMEMTVAYKVISGGSEAVDYLTGQGVYRTQPEPLPKMVLLDLNIPGLNGFEVIQHIRASSRTRHLPIIVFSTSDNPKDINRSVELGVNAYVVKPGGYHSLGQSLRRLCDFWLKENCLAG